MGVRAREPEGSLVKICDRMAGTLLASVVRGNFLAASMKHLPIKVEGSWVGGGEAGLRGNASLCLLNENHLLSSVHLQMISWA